MNIHFRIKFTFVSLPKTRFHLRILLGNFMNKNQAILCSKLIQIAKLN